MMDMKKIPTLFVRETTGRRHVTPVVTPGCEWVLAGEGKATEKVDGQCVLLIVRGGKCVELKRRERHEDGDIDALTFVSLSPDAACDKWLRECRENVDVSGLPDGEYPAEAVGPKIQGNPIEYPKHDCYIFSARPVVFELPIPTFESLRQLFADLKSAVNPERLAEGIVWRHADGRMAKLKRKDFAK